MHATKRDQVQAYSFVVGRLRSALLRGDADAVETPTRRFSLAAFAGLLLAAVLLAGCGVLGFMFPGNDKSWRQPGSLIIEKETGSRFVYVHGVLHPVLNLASARLLLGGQPAVRTVSARSLRGVPHGPTVGIAGAPDALPDPKLLTGAGWVVCAEARPDVAGQPEGRVSVYIGQSPATAGVAPDVAVPVVTPDGASYLVWQGRRLRVVDRTALVALGHGGVRPFPVPATWLNAVPQGVDLRAPVLARRGEPGPTVDGTATRVGQVLTVHRATGGTDFYAVLADGLAAISPVTASLLLADPASRSSYGDAPVRPVETSAFGVVAAPRSAVSLELDGLPATPPTAYDGYLGDRQALCARHRFDGGDTVELLIGDVGETPVSVESESPFVADAVRVSPGAGVLAQAAQTLFLVTDIGTRYPIANAEAAAALGYAAVPPTPVPAELLAFLPTGPALDPDRATTLHPGLATPQSP